ncbi:hypothetical protein N7527_004883 [Penicillium freii]|nr:hypothetical protein N7527_004883 [Penicillium freii]
MADCGIKGVRETIEGHIPGRRESGWVGQWNRLVVARLIGMAGSQALVARRPRSGAIIHAASVGPSWHRWPMVLRGRMPPSLPCAYMDSDENGRQVELEDLCVSDETECYADSSGEAKMIFIGW